jgi:hypothetical protein
MVSPFTLSDLPEFPYSDFSEQQSKYHVYETWYSGSALQSTQQQGSKSIDIYPLHINPIRSACLKHSYALFGEFPDDISGTLVSPRVILTSKQEKELSSAVEDALTKIWYDNNGASLMMQNGLLSQIYGGCIFKLSWIPEPKPGKIRIEVVHPAEFIATPYANDYWRLKSAWIVRKIHRDTAKEYNVTIASEYGYYIEWWKEDEFQVLINDNPIVTDIPNGQRVMGGKNPFGFVPFVYIPHQRADTFIGESIVTDAAIGITKELNLREADAGDATSDQSHSVLAMRNVRGTPQMKVLGNNTSYVDLGASQNITNTGGEPDLFSVTRSEITGPVLDLIDELREEIRREVFVPAIAEGIDKGSQRSAATLVMRMWPLTSHIKSERAHWSTGLTVLHKMILTVLEMKKGLYGITKKHLDVPLKNKWYPILPRDRQAFVEELVARRGVDIGSLQHILGLIGDVEDIELVVDQIMEEREFNAELKKGGTDNGSESDSRGSEEAQRNRGRKVSNKEPSSGSERT